MLQWLSLQAEQKVGLGLKISLKQLFDRNLAQLRPRSCLWKADCFFAGKTSDKFQELQICVLEMVFLDDIHFFCLCCT